MSATRVELITIGDELLLGFTIDTNAAHISRTLAAAGVEVVRRTTVGDEADKIAEAVREAIDRTGAVITTGGLGPTSDDLTKPSIAKLFGFGGGRLGFVGIGVRRREQRQHVRELSSPAHELSQRFNASGLRSETVINLVVREIFIPGPCHPRLSVGWKAPALSGKLGQ